MICALLYSQNGERNQAWHIVDTQYLLRGCAHTHPYMSRTFLDKYKKKTLTAIISKEWTNVMERGMFVFLLPGSV